MKSSICIACQTVVDEDSSTSPWSKVSVKLRIYIKNILPEPAHCGFSCWHIWSDAVTMICCSHQALELEADIQYFGDDIFK